MNAVRDSLVEVYSYLENVQPMIMIIWCLLIFYIVVFILSGVVKKITQKKVVARGVLTTWGNDEPRTLKHITNSSSASLFRFCNHPLIIGVVIALLIFALTPVYASGATYVSL